MLRGLIFGLVLPLMTAGLLYAGTFAATTRALRAARTWWPRLHEWLAAIVGLNSFASTLMLLFAFFVLAIGFWHRFL